MASVYPAREDFKQKAQNGNLIPVYREIIADLDTPVSAFKKLEGSQDAFLLESVEGGEQVARFSFLGVDPLVTFRSKRNSVEVSFRNGNKQSYDDPCPLDRLRDLMSNYKFVPDASLPPFCGGAVGYVSYEEIANLEPVPRSNPDHLKIPDIYFVVADSLIIFDHLRHRMKILVNSQVDHVSDADSAYDAAIHRINQLQHKLQRSLPYSDNTVASTRTEVYSNFTPEEFTKAVNRCKEYIAAGDAFQVVISQRFAVNVTCDAFEIYRSLRSINPSPYMFYLKFNDFRLVGTSPEILVRVENGKVQVRPIAGTRRRGSTPEEDDDLQADLLSDPKERAEHIMLVDLGRNDCGRVCKHGTVVVNDLMSVEKYSHVMHIVSNVQGELDPHYDSFDVFKAAFPAGTVSGAPKIRAMQIIDEVEPSSRGAYAGSVGYFSFNGNFDSCITIRTVLVKDDMAYVQAGAGIVADSDPEMEFRETVNKASAMLNAIEIADYGQE